MVLSNVLIFIWLKNSSKSTAYGIFVKRCLHMHFAWHGSFVSSLGKIIISMKMLLQQFKDGIKNKADDSLIV